MSLIETFDTLKMRRLADHHWALLAKCDDKGLRELRLSVANSCEARWLLLHNADPLLRYREEAA